MQPASTQETFRAHIAEMLKRKCHCGTPIQMIEVSRDCVAWRYPCICDKDPKGHPLTRVWYGVLPEDD